MPLQPVSLDANEFEYQDQPQSDPRQTPTTGPVAKAGQFLKGLGVAAVTGPLKLAEAPYHALEAVDKALGNPNPEQWEGKYPSERVEELFDPESIRPENIVSEALQYTAGNWPLLFLGGGPTLAKLGTDFAGSLGVSSAKALGFGTLGQIGAGILGSKGFKSAAQALNLASKDPSHIKDYTKKIYDRERDLGSKIKVNPQPTIKKLDDLYKQVDNEYIGEQFSASDQSEVLKNITSARNSLDKNSITASDLFNEKKKLNAIWARPGSTKGELTQDLRSIVNDSLDSLESNNKEWGNAWKDANNLYSIEHWQTGLGKAIKDLSGSGKLGKIASNPLTYGLLSVLTKGTIGPKAALAVGIPVALGAGSKAIEGGKHFYDFATTLWKTPEGQKVMWNIVADSAKNNVAGVASNLSKIDHMAKKYEKDHLEEEQILKPVSLDANEFEFAD